MLRAAYPRRRAEPTIALINIVFLMLIFFMIAGALAPPLDGDVDLIDTRDLAGRAPPDAPVLMADGRLVYRGAPVEVSEIVDPGQPVRIVVDRAVPARLLMARVAALRGAGAREVWIITARGLQ